MREQPKSPPKIAPQAVSTITQVREYELITPLFGGGVKPGEADAVTVVRATEIRGHLRFWWRACRGGRYKNISEMKKGEDAIWGKAHTKEEDGVAQEQTVQIVLEPLVQTKQLLEPFPIKVEEKMRKSIYDPRTNIPSYAAFPLQYNKDELKELDPPKKTVRTNVRFRFTISFEERYEADIKAALWAWETFGGIGARTRRGFGALRCVSVKSNQDVLIDLPLGEDEEVEKWIEIKLDEHVVQGSWLVSVPHLSKQGHLLRVISEKNNRDVFLVWNDLIDRLKSFRQMRSKSNKPNARHPGRSLWSEPSTIRFLTKQSLTGHSSPVPNPAIHKFPRAAFGLPIIFKFIDADKYNFDKSDKDPRKTELRLKTSERFASPLILKPLACREGVYVGLALILEGTSLNGNQLILKTQEGKEGEWNVEASLGSSETLLLKDSSGNLHQIDSQTNALKAFLKYL